MTKQSFDVIVIGGSYAGLSAAMALGRSLRDVLIIDAGEPCNAPTPHSHNFITQDGSTPGQIAAIAKNQVLKYPTVKLCEDFAFKAMKQNDAFVVETRNSGQFQAKTLLLATGVKDTYPSISGLRECWGKTVLHCPYCHGYEVQGKKLAVISNGDAAVDFTRMILNLSQDVMLLTNGAPELTADSLAFIRSIGMAIVSHPVTNIIHKAGQLQEIKFENGESLARDAVFMRLPFTHHSEIAMHLGCELNDTNHIKVDNQFGMTSVEGVYAAGDCTTPQRSVSIAVASGTKAGIGINKYLLDRQKFHIVQPISTSPR